MTPQEFGELIRAHREAKGLSVEDLALRFKLSTRSLYALEEGRLDHMPSHAVYAKGFVRAYAQAVGVDNDDLREGLALMFPEEMLAEVPGVPSPISTKAVAGKRGDGMVGLLLVLIVVGILGGAGWFLYARFDFVKELVTRPLSAISSPSTVSESADIPERAVVPVENETLSTPSRGTEQSVSQAVSQAASSDETSVVSVPESAASSSVMHAPAAVTESVQEPAHVTESPIQTTITENSAITSKQVSLTAKEECWVQVSVDGSGTRQFTIYPGETSLLPYRSRVTLVLGNAGGVNIAHNGKPFEMSAKRNEKRTLAFQ